MNITRKIMLSENRSVPEANPPLLRDLREATILVYSLPSPTSGVVSSHRRGVVDSDGSA